MEKQLGSEYMNDLKALTPKDTVSELDKYIIGQDAAKNQLQLLLETAGADNRFHPLYMMR